MNKTELVKREILNFAILALKEKLTLPSNITFQKEEGDCGIFNAKIEILKIKFLCDVECNVTTANASTIVNRMRERMITENRPAILVTKYINTALFEKLVAYGINILDCAGNCYIRYTKGETNIFHLINKGEKNIFAKEKVYPIFQDAGIKVIFYFSYGELAAQIASHAIADFIATNIHKYAPQELLRKAFCIADKSILQKCYELKCKMGAAVCIALIVNNSIYYVWQGNVRLYKKNNDILQLLTTDHIANSGGMTLLARCVNGKGFREQIPVEYVPTDNSNAIFLCSDGYYLNTDNMLSSLPLNLNDDASIIEIIFE